VSVHDHGNYCTCDETCRKCELTKDGLSFVCTECVDSNYMIHDSHCVAFCPHGNKKLKDDVTHRFSCVSTCPPEK
jgi:hypothetical protein